MSKKHTSQVATGSQAISLVAIKAISSLVEKELKARAKTEEIAPGVYNVDEVIRVIAGVTRAPDTSVTEKFDYGNFVRDVLLLYASHVTDGEGWLNQILGESSYFVEQLTSPKTRETALQAIKPELVEQWERLQKINKERAPLKLVPRAGATSVVGQLLPVDESSA